MNFLESIIYWYPEFILLILIGLSGIDTLRKKFRKAGWIDIIILFAISALGVLLLIELMSPHHSLFGGAFMADPLSRFYKILLLCIYGLTRTGPRLRSPNTDQDNTGIAAMMMLLAAFLLSSASHILSVIIALELFSFTTILFVSLTEMNSAKIIPPRFILLNLLATALLLFALLTLCIATNRFTFDEIGEKLVSDPALSRIGILFFPLVVISIGYKIFALAYRIMIIDRRLLPRHGYLFLLAVAALWPPSLRLIGHLFQPLINITPLYAVVFSIMLFSVMIAANYRAVRAVGIEALLGYSAPVHLGMIFLGILLGTADSIGGSHLYLLNLIICYGGIFYLEKSADIHPKIARFGLIVLLISLIGLPVTLGFPSKLILLVEMNKSAYPLPVLFLLLLNLIPPVWYYGRQIRSILNKPYTENVTVVIRSLSNTYPLMLIGVQLAFVFYWQELLTLLQKL